MPEQDNRRIIFTIAVAIFILGIAAFPYFLSPDFFAPVERILPYHALLLLWIFTLFLAIHYRISKTQSDRNLYRFKEAIERKLDEAEQ